MDIDFYRTRAAQERQAALSGPIEARSIHGALAKAYEQRARFLTELLGDTTVDATNKP